MPSATKQSLRNQDPTLSAVTEAPGKKRRKWPWIAGIILVLAAGSAIDGGSDTESTQSPSVETQVESQDISGVDQAAGQENLAGGQTEAEPAPIDQQPEAESAPIDQQPEAESAPIDQQPAAPAESGVPADFKSALRQADTYANKMHMSKLGLYDQLTSEYGGQFSPEAAQYAVDNVEADWNANALAKAKDYQEDMAMSPSAIYDQLVSEYGEQFTPAEADYAVQNLNQ
ncbi:Ltp family lipoprotein [Arthrobacter sp. zg-Y769]|uniref:Ltp family lipoprotein n=1 Tax=Arthrobacter sp. zg-Y769 TaxID=2894191 RepID=UPI001E5E007B|nr:Ltp family lipoprotein [Arthrobacter sp. zg-Y769]MCC9206462.1 Ltp family lipoprotein [Arthrobacter sp. zg-Y769]